MIIWDKKPLSRIPHDQLKFLDVGTLLFMPRMQGIFIVRAETNTGIIISPFHKSRIRRFWQKIKGVFGNYESVIIPLDETLHVVKRPRNGGKDETSNL